MVPNRPDAERADILIDGDTIAAVGENLDAAGAAIIDVPGPVCVIETHRPKFPWRPTVVGGSLAKHGDGVGPVCDVVLNDDDEHGFPAELVPRGAAGLDWCEASRIPGS